MKDAIFEAFLRSQYKDAMALAAQSDRFELLPWSPGGDPVSLLARLASSEPPALPSEVPPHADPPDHYLVHFRCKCLVREPGGELGEVDDALVEIWFPPDYLRRVEPMQILTFLAPPNCFHPNIRPPLICVGHIVPGTTLVDLLYQLYEIIAYWNWAAHDALNPEASQWARNHQNRLPLDRRPLKRRPLPLNVQQQQPEARP